LVAELRQKLAAEREATAAAQGCLDKQEQRLAALGAVCARTQKQVAALGRARGELEQELETMRQAYAASEEALHQARRTIKSLNAQGARDRQAAQEQVEEAQGRLTELECAYETELERMLGRLSPAAPAPGPGPQGGLLESVGEGDAEAPSVVVPLKRPRPPRARHTA
jgi:chromosome segregation ATPase